MRTYDSKDLTDPVRDTADKIARTLYDLGNAADRYLQRTGLDRIFFHSIWLNRDTPLLHVAETQEIQEPFRSTGSLIVKLPRATKGVAIGIWSEKGTSAEEGLLRAVTGQEPEQEDLDQFDTESTLRDHRTVVEGAEIPGTSGYRAARASTPSYCEAFCEEHRDRDGTADDAGPVGVSLSDPEWNTDPIPTEPLKNFKFKPIEDLELPE